MNKYTDKSASQKIYCATDNKIKPSYPLYV